jgi:hypothetical protein
MAHLLQVWMPRAVTQAPAQCAGEVLLVVPPGAFRRPVVVSGFWPAVHTGATTAATTTDELFPPPHCPPLLDLFV